MMSTSTFTREVLLRWCNDQSESHRESAKRYEQNPMMSQLFMNLAVRFEAVAKALLVGTAEPQPDARNPVLSGDRVIAAPRVPLTAEAEQVLRDAQRWREHGPKLSEALRDLLRVIASDDLIPESVSYMRYARDVLAAAETDQ